MWYYSTYYIVDFDSTFNVAFTSASSPPADGMCIVLVRASSLAASVKRTHTPHPPPPPHRPPAAK